MKHTRRICVWKPAEASPDLWYLPLRDLFPSLPRSEESVISSSCEVGVSGQMHLGCCPSVTVTGDAVVDWRFGANKLLLWIPEPVDNTDPVLLFLDFFLRTTMVSSWSILLTGEKVDERLLAESFARQRAVRFGVWDTASVQLRSFRFIRQCQRRCRFWRKLYDSLLQLITSTSGCQSH